MGVLGRLLRREVNEGGEQGAKTATLPCRHTVLGPRWDCAEDMGNESKATSYRCEACEETFRHEEVERLRAEDTERLKATLSR